jgi:hypothetical protein
MFIGVSLPVFTPSTSTWAADGNDDTLRVAAVAAAVPASDTRARRNGIFRNHREYLPTAAPPSWTAPNLTLLLIRAKR